MKNVFFLLLVVTIVSCSSAKKSLVCYWYKPKTLVNIRFNVNNTFEMSDYDSIAKKPLVFTGTYKLNRPVITLEFKDKTTENLTFDKLEKGTRTYYVKRNDIFFIKDERVNHAVPADSVMK